MNNEINESSLPIHSCFDKFYSIKQSNFKTFNIKNNLRLFYCLLRKKTFIPSLVVLTIPSLKSRCFGVFSVDSISYVLSSLIRQTFISRIANFIPMQFLCV